MTVVSPPTSNTTVTIPDAALNPTEGTFQVSNMEDSTKALYEAAATLGRSAFFINPVSGPIHDVANSAIELNSSIDASSLSVPDQEALQALLLGVGGNSVTFSEALANTSVVEISYTGPAGTLRETFAVTDDTTQDFTLADEVGDPDSIEIFVNGVYQSNVDGANYSTSTSTTPTSISAAMSTMMAHTDRLSGLREATGDNQIDLENILSVGASLNIILNSLNETASAQNVYYAMASLFAGARFTAIANRILIIRDDVNAGVANVASITTEMNGFIAEFAALIQADLDYYSGMLELMKSSSLTTIVESIADSPEGKFLIRELIGTQTVRDIITGI